MPLPIAPSIRTQVAEYLAASDTVRCGFDAHGWLIIQARSSCPHCHMDLSAYREAVGTHWPEPAQVKA